jgi:hypothetical protein
MSFVRGNPIGWAFLEKLTSAQMNTTDAQWPNAIDGGAGGTYAPSTAITIGGLGVIVTSRLDVTGAATLRMLSGSFLTVDATSGITGNAGALLTWQGPITLSNGITMSVTASSLLTFDATSTMSAVAGASLVWHGSSHFFGTFTSDGVSTFNSAASFFGAVDFEALVSFSATSSADFAGPVEFDGNVKLFGKGNLSERSIFLSNNGNHTIGVASGTLFTNGADELIQLGTGSSATTITVTATGARAGNHISFSWWETVNALTLANDASATICQLKSGVTGANNSRAAPPTGFYNWVRLVFTGTAWAIDDGWSA